NMLPYLLRNAMVVMPNRQLCPEDIIEDYRLHLSNIATQEPKTFQIPLPRGSKLNLPYGNSPVLVSEMAFEYKRATGMPINNVTPTGEIFDAMLHARPEYEYENILT